jgi:hypothetical protein
MHTMYDYVKYQNEFVQQRSATAWAEFQADAGALLRRFRPALGKKPVLEGLKCRVGVSVLGTAVDLDLVAALDDAPAGGGGGWWRLAHALGFAPRVAQLYGCELR